MRTPMVWTLGAAVITAAAVMAAGRLLIRPDLPLLRAAEFSLDTITPNADGTEDATVFSYEITRASQISLILTGEDGREYVFRRDQPRGPDEYEVLFSGVVEGYTLPDETIDGQVLRRLMPDGQYTWIFRVVAEDDGEVAEQSGTLIIENADVELPLLTGFTVYPAVFTPNQDGVYDRTQVNVYLEKEADLDVYLLNEAGQRLYMARREEGREEGEEGLQQFDYEGGVDAGADPPPDGTYTVVARVQDAEGQVIERTQQLTILNGGKPRAEIYTQPSGVTVVFETQPYEDRYFTDAETVGDPVAAPADPESLTRAPLSMRVGDMLVFRLTVYNYGPTPIRTTGPVPGTVYQQDQIAASLGAYQSSGAWRVGIQCETSTEPYPYRWAIGGEDDLFTETIEGDEFYYLAPGEFSVVWGAVRFTELIDLQNPQACWAGLIHEDVEISLQNTNVDPREIRLEPVAETETDYAD